VNASTRPGAQETTGLDGASELLTAPQGFRERLDGAMRRRQGALIDLTGAILTAGPVPSPVHVSLAPACRRGWISLYAALAKGQIDGVTRGKRART
jgi:hypothetical protein